MPYTTVSTAESGRGPINKVNHDSAKVSEAYRGSFPTLSSFASSRDLEATGKAGLVSDTSSMSRSGARPSQQVSLLLLPTRPRGWLL